MSPILEAGEKVKGAEGRQERCRYSELSREKAGSGCSQ